MRARIGKLQALLRYSFWFVPAVMSVAAAALSLLLTETDIGSRLPPIAWVTSLGPQGVRDLLVMIASSMITVATTAFSIIIVALQLASGQLGPRLLRNFIRDRANQLVFGTFLGAFVYSFLLIRRISSSGARGAESRVPDVAISLAVGLGLAAVGVLIFFIHHAALSIQKDRVIARVSQELVTSLDKLYPKGIGAEPPYIASGTAQRLPESAVTTWQESYRLTLDGGGYIQAVDAVKLMKVAVKHDLQIYLTKRPGDFVNHDAEVALIRPTHAVTPRISRGLQDIFVLGSERTAQQDVAFVFDQLVEIAIRALSPGITDSFTALRCIDRLADALALVARTPFPSPYRFDSGGTLRVITRPVSFDVLVSLVLYPVAEASAGYTNVVVRLFETTREIGLASQQKRERQALLRFNDYLLDVARTAPALLEHYADLETLHENARQAILG
ncbi:MAG: DUF2254 domain-containing protein [Alkalispirochaeta sp.]